MSTKSDMTSIKLRFIYKLDTYILIYAFRNTHIFSNLPINIVWPMMDRTTNFTLILASVISL